MLSWLLSTSRVSLMLLSITVRFPSCPRSHSMFPANAEQVSVVCPRGAKNTPLGVTSVESTAITREEGRMTPRPGCFKHHKKHTSPWHCAHYEPFDVAIHAQSNSVQYSHIAGWYTDLIIRNKLGMSRPQSRLCATPFKTWVLLLHARVIYELTCRCDVVLCSIKEICFIQLLRSKMDDVNISDEFKPSRGIIDITEDMNLLTRPPIKTNNTYGNYDVITIITDLRTFSR